MEEDPKDSESNAEETTTAAANNTSDAKFRLLCGPLTLGRLSRALGGTPLLWHDHGAQLAARGPARKR